MRIGVAQIDQEIHNRAVVLDKAIGAVGEAAGQGVELLLFPELCTTGYIPNFDLWDRLGAGADFVDALRGPARAHGLHIWSGHAELVDGTVLNTYVMIDPEGTIIGRSIKENAEPCIFHRGERAHRLRTRVNRHLRR